MKIIAIDYGKARTGIAVCDKTEMLATPLCVIPSYNEEKLLSDICLKIRENNIEKVILGLPERTDGKASEMAENMKLFAGKLSTLSGLEIEFVDEKFTTVIACRMLHENNVKAKAQKSLIDAAAAAVLLQGYIDSNRRSN